MQIKLYIQLPNVCIDFYIFRGIRLLMRLVLTVHIIISIIFMNEVMTASFSASLHKPDLLNHDFNCNIRK